jgi:hypothetical protein
MSRTVIVKCVCWSQRPLFFYLYVGVIAVIAVDSMKPTGETIPQTEVSMRVSFAYNSHS